MNEVDFSKVGLKMKQLRSERGITQEQVAKDLNCTVPFVSNVENNRAKLNLRVLLYYSKLCNVSVDTILDAGRDIPPLDEKEHQLNDEMLNVFRGFSVTEKEKIIKMLRIWQEKYSPALFIPKYARGPVDFYILLKILKHNRSLIPAFLYINDSLILASSEHQCYIF